MTQTPQPICTVCQAKSLLSCLSFGEQPPSNRFLAANAGDGTSEDFCVMSVGYCQQCGTIQLVDRMPLEVVRPRYDWLVYNEPEKHLDDVARKLSELSGINKSSRFLGITYKDKSTLDRMNRLGFPNTACVSEDDLMCPVQPFGLESIQGALITDSTIERLRKAYGSVDVLIARHIIEHASDASRLISSLRGLLAFEGYILLELPDSESILSAGNHAFIWEEHISYFTEASINILAKIVGAELIWLMRYSYPFEDSLIVLLRFSGAERVPFEVSPEVPEYSATILADFAKRLHGSCIKWHKELEVFRAKGERVAVFGAGHLAAKLINFYELADLIDCVIDDHPKKVGMLMPGSHLPIVSSAEMVSRGIQVCISTLSPESEIKVRNKLTSFFSGGGRFIPAFN